MDILYPEIKLNKRYRIDFSLIPIGILILEFAIFFTDLAKSDFPNVADLALVRLLHTTFLLAISALLSRVYQRMQQTEISYLGIALPSTAGLLMGLIIYRALASGFNIETVSLPRNIAVVLLQGFFWAPVFLILGSMRSDIYVQFIAYEQRLITSTRLESRTSDEFKENQGFIQDKIRLDLINLCKSLHSRIKNVDLQKLELQEANSQIQSLLLGDELRKLSMKLDTFGSEHEEKTFLGQSTHTLKLLIIQFRILYATIARIAPLKTKTYAITLIILIIPPYLNYFTLQEALISFPLVSIAIFICSALVTKVMASSSPHNLRNSSILIYVTGLMPLLSNQIGQSITHNPRTAFPMYIEAFTLPFGYYIFVKALQVLQPDVIQMIARDELRASKALKETVKNLVTNEFSHNLSHRWAIYIHGKILTRLAATSLKLETAANGVDRAAFFSGIESLLELLEHPDREFVHELNNLETEIQSRLDPWIGLLDVDVQIDEKLKTIRNERVRDLGEVIEEIISNSMRHGKAQHVILRVIQSGDQEINITAIDDATIPPPQFQTRFGLGSRIFSLVSDGRWSISRVDSQTKIELTMSIAV